jgi:hypothetical protein
MLGVTCHGLLQLGFLSTQQSVDKVTKTVFQKQDFGFQVEVDFRGWLKRTVEWYKGVRKGHEL